MFESIPTLRVELASRLEQSLPHDWQIVQTALGEAGVEELLVKLIGVLDPHTDLAWQNARKLRVESSGVWSWQLTLSAFVATDSLTEAEV